MTANASDPHDVQVAEGDEPQSTPFLDTEENTSNVEKAGGTAAANSDHSAKQSEKGDTVRTIRGFKVRVLTRKQQPRELTDRFFIVVVYRLHDTTFHRLILCAREHRRTYMIPTVDCYFLFYLFFIFFWHIFSLAAGSQHPAIHCQDFQER